MVKTYSACTTNQKPDLLDDILQETDELIKIFVTSIKTAEKKKKQMWNVQYWVFVFSFDVGRSMFDVHLLKQPRLNTAGQASIH